MLKKTTCNGRVMCVGGSIVNNVYSQLNMSWKSTGDLLGCIIS